MAIALFVFLGWIWLLAGPQTATDIPPALAGMVEAERSFAASARELGVRDAFLKFFADDAVLFVPDPVVAREGLLARPSVPFAEEALTWEPRLGDIAASGELGWLTGPSAFIVGPSSGSPPRHNNYLSVWKRQPDGAWRVIIDVGTTTPAEPSFAPGFNRFGGGDDRAAGTTTFARPLPLAEADRALNAALARDGLQRGYGPVLLDVTRFHRARTMPIVGPAAIAAWLEGAQASFIGNMSRAESAASGDLGFSYGSYVLGAPVPESGSYLRIWHRASDGTWRLAVDLAQRRPPPG